MNVDGTGQRQLTDSEYDDIDPLYLPDGHILFTSTRGNSYVRCGPFIYSYTLARCDADGRNVYLISHNGEPDFVMSWANWLRSSTKPCSGWKTPLSLSSDSRRTHRTNCAHH